jgi:hypothetical protein
MLSGCTNAGAPAVAEPTPRTDAAQTKPLTRVIVKFRDPDLDPSRKTYLRELSYATGTQIAYVRPLSGGAHVLRIETAVDVEQLQRVVNVLASRPEVEYAEPDRPLRH